jgi:hypothetical protein
MFRSPDATSSSAALGAALAPSVGADIQQQYGHLFDDSQNQMPSRAISSSDVSQMQQQQQQQFACILLDREHAAKRPHTEFTASMDLLADNISGLRSLGNISSTIESLAKSVDELSRSNAAPSTPEKPRKLPHLVYNKIKQKGTELEALLLEKMKTI